MNSIQIYVYKVVGMIKINDSISKNTTQAKEKALIIAKKRPEVFEESDCDLIAISFSGNEILKGRL